MPSTNECNFTFRRANVEDMKAVRQMIQELAEFEKMGDCPQIGEEDLKRDCGLDGGKEYCHIYVLDLNEDREKGGPIGYAICYFGYSTWQGRSYILEDLYVKTHYRRKGAGTRLFKEIAAKAKEYNCKRLDFHVLEWNPACKFYKKMGAIDLSVEEKWHFYRIDENQIDNLVKDLHT